MFNDITVIGLGVLAVIALMALSRRLGKGRDSRDSSELNFSSRENSMRHAPPYTPGRPAHLGATQPPRRDSGAGRSDDGSFIVMAAATSSIGDDNSSCGSGYDSPDCGSGSVSDSSSCGCD